MTMKETKELIEKFHNKKKSDIEFVCNLDTITEFILKLMYSTDKDNLPEEKKESPQFLVMKNQIRHILNEKFLPNSTSDKIEEAVEKIADEVSNFCVEDDEEKVLFAILVLNRIKEILSF